MRSMCTLVFAVLAAGCAGLAPDAQIGDPPATLPGEGSGSAPAPAPAPPPGTTPSPDAGVPPVATTYPDVNQSSACGGAAPITLAQAVTANGCSLAAGARSGCPQYRPSNRSLDGVFGACLIGVGQDDCQPAPPFVECPVGHNAGPVYVTSKPPLGQAGYGFQVDVQRSYINGSITLTYDAWETGVRSDGTIAWSGPHATGSASMSDDACCEVQYLVDFPGSGLGEKITADLHWF
jgi:hypothetical protein